MAQETDAHFISNFIQRCTDRGICSPDEICGEARREIERIDEQARVRSKLFDVIRTFGSRRQPPGRGRPNMETTVEAGRELMGIIGHQTLLKDLTERLRGYPDEHRKSLIFTFKCLVQNQVLARDDHGVIVLGPRYGEFFGTGDGGQNHTDGSLGPS